MLSVPQRCAHVFGKIFQHLIMWKGDGAVKPVAHHRTSQAHDVEVEVKMVDLSLTSTAECYPCGHEECASWRDLEFPQDRSPGIAVDIQFPIAAAEVVVGPEVG